MAREGFSTEVISTNKELTAKQRVALKNTNGFKRLDQETDNGVSLTVYPAMWAVLAVHNEKSENKDYKIYVIQDKDTGIFYKTSSDSFWDTFTDIAGEMQDEDEEWGIEIYKLDSKNYQGKQFLTCSII